MRASEQKLRVDASLFNHRQAEILHELGEQSNALLQAAGALEQGVAYEDAAKAVAKATLEADFGAIESQLGAAADELDLVLSSSLGR